MHTIIIIGRIVIKMRNSCTLKENKSSYIYIYIYIYILINFLVILN